MMISELSRLTNTSTRMLRHYETRGLLSPDRDNSGYRTYTVDDVERVKSIRCLLEAGLSTDEAVVMYSSLCGRRLFGAKASERDAALAVLDRRLDHVRSELDAAEQRCIRISTLREQIAAD